ncbi:MAG: PEP-CTERM sorting domain-containing protein [Chthoniobacterales bacterium]
MATVVLLGALVWFVPRSAALVIWDENLNGPLSTNAASPTSLNLALGTNSIISRIGGANRDYFTFSLAPTQTLVAFRLSSYVSTDAVSWIALQNGPAWTAGDNTALMLAHQHFGTANLGNNLLGVSTNTPLAAGTYTVRAQQIGATTDYQLELTVVPEPSTYALLLMTGAGALWWARRRR